MAKKREEKVRSKIRLVVKVTLEDAKHEELPELVVYAFDRSGKFLHSAPSPRRVEGEVKLTLPDTSKGNTVRILVGPSVMEDLDEIPPWLRAVLEKQEVRGKAPSMSYLLRKGAYEKRVRLREHDEVLKVVLFPDVWKKFLFCRCIDCLVMVRRMA